MTSGRNCLSNSNTPSKNMRNDTTLLKTPLVLMATVPPLIQATKAIVKTSTKRPSYGRDNIATSSLDELPDGSASEQVELFLQRRKPWV